MTTRARPEGCCPIRSVPPLATPWRERLVAGYRALGDPTRLEILRLVAAQEGPTCVCDIVDHFELSQPTISHHLKVLREAGIVECEKRGLWAYYRVNARALMGAVKTLAELA